MTARLMVTLLLATPGVVSAQQDGMVRVRSARAMDATVSALDSALAARKLTLFARVDHAANARGVGMELRPTVVFIFGNPMAGTRVMQCGQTAGLDLPLRLLVWKDDADAVWIGYEDPSRLAARHGIGACAEPLERMRTGLAGLAREAAGGTP
ncbi:MAG TPA: DUF302 domain-containing protein [Gemmatimonadales bacterium]|nr:DUF302 domain-containing protein [Gemmatimonadales bacterium]